MNGKILANGVETAYRFDGPATGRVVMLSNSLMSNYDMWDWTVPALSDRYRVLRYDTRGHGRSSTPPGPYSIATLADDAAALLDALGIGAVHFAGLSMGGMIGQHLALEHPDAVRSLTSIMSTPGGRRYLPKPFALKALFMKPPRTPEEAGDSVDTFFRTVGGYGYPHDSDRLRAIGQLSHQRGVNPRGFLRHFAAIMGTADRRPAMKGSRVPTLVIHGTSDPLIPPSAGRATARLIPNATWLPISGMGHGLPSAVWPTVVSAIARHAERADARATV